MVNICKKKKEFLLALKDDGLYDFENGSTTQRVLLQYYIPKWKMLLTPNISTTEEFLYYQKNIYSIWYLCMCILHFFYVIFFR